MKEEKRFEIIKKEASFSQELAILRDRQTGVQYLFYKSGYGGGLTPLLDADGKPSVVSEREAEEYK